MERLLWVCLGSAIGGGLRYAVSELALRTLGAGFPYGTLAVNVVGSFAIAVVIQLSHGAGQIGPELRLFLATGVMGGFTTYSAFNFEMLQLVRDGHWHLALANGVATVGVCLAAGVAGLWLGRSLAAS